MEKRWKVVVMASWEGIFAPTLVISAEGICQKMKIREERILLQSGAVYLSQGLENLPSQMVIAVAYPLPALAFS